VCVCVCVIFLSVYAHVYVRACNKVCCLYVYVCLSDILCWFLIQASTEEAIVHLNNEPRSILVTSVIEFSRFVLDFDHLFKYGLTLGYLSDIG